ncbi:MAG: hypothetical protein K0R68_1561 [Mycobacterium sp.]|nr:hypothetical protein [Mycobacterium sp.]
MRNRPAVRSLRERLRPTGPDNRLDHIDQALYLGLRATGQAAVCQCLWIYEHDIDLDGLKRFHENFGHGLAGRRIEASPLPFGRHRWVSSPGAPAEILFEEGLRPRAELMDWADSHACRPVDPEWGPVWHMGVQRFTDGSTAVSLVGSHCVGDGGGACLTVFEAVTGNTRDLGYPAPHARTRRAAIRADARDTIRDLPETGRTLVAAAKLAYKRRHDLKGSGGAETERQLGPEGDRHVVVPAVAVYVDGADWDACAAALGGNSYSLVAGFAARLGERMGRRSNVDGAVPLTVPINDRTLEDTRANAVVLANVRVDPTGVASDLTAARAALKQGMATAKEAPDETLALVPLTPFIPKRAVRKTADLAFGFTTDLPVFCSNMGQLPAEISRIDGTEAEHVILRGVDQFVPLRVLEQRQGLLTVVAARVGTKLSLAVIGYRPGAENTKARLHAIVAETLSEFGVTGEIE